MYGLSVCFWACLASGLAVVAGGVAVVAILLVDGKELLFA